MALTLLEASKYTTDMLQKAVVETFAKSSPVLEVIPFMEIAGNSYKYNVESTLGSVAFRATNEGYTESTGTMNQISEALTILGTTSDVDKFLVQTRGNQQDLRAIQTELKVKALAAEFTRTFFFGNSAEHVNEFDGLNTRLKGEQVILAGENGGELTLALLDELIDAVHNEPDAIYVSKPVRRKLKALLQASNHYIENGTDSFGAPVMTYGGIPIRVVETDAQGKEILGFNEKVGTNENTASIFAVKYGAEQFVSGLQNQGITVTDLGLLSEKPVYRTLIEWYCSMAVFHPKAAAVLKGIVK